MEDAMKTSEAIQKIWDLIRDVKIAMLTTVGSEGELRSRPMATQEAKFDGDLWFLTRQQSGTADEISHGAHVCLTYVNNEAHAYVSLSGRAALSSDREKIHELWKPMHSIWFPLGKDDPDIAAIQVTVEQAEYWESPGNTLVRSYHMLRAMIAKDASLAGEHEKIAL